ncbi:ParA family protein [Deinococcus kurensis]|uniref:ParA family protein n=1 Tax=Deinococcus kurensis TaxID=2662757 RepID=UPI0012D32295|nr:ParA family protein [Deinococcus kurensis]
MGTAVISVASEKGGVGKSTTAVALASHLSSKGRTLLLDADERLRSAWNWTTKNEGYSWPFTTQIHSEFMAQEGGEEYDYIIIDTKGGEDELIELARNSTLVVIPTKPDGVSADGLVATLQSLMEQNVTNYRVLLTDVPPPPNSDGLDMRLELDNAGVPVFGHTIRHAVAVSKAAREGISVRDVKGDRYAKLVWMDYEVIAREVLRHVE